MVIRICFWAVPRRDDREAVTVPRLDENGATMPQP